MNREAVKNKWIILLVFAIIFFSNDTLLFGTSSNANFTTIGKYQGFILASLMVIYALFHSRVVLLQKKPCMTLILLIISMLFTIIINNERFNVYIMLVSIMVGALLFCSYVSYEKFVDCFLTVMFFLAAVSLVVFVLRIIIPGIFSGLPTIKNYLGYAYKTYFLGSYARDSSIIRNASIFRESGVNAIYLCLAVYFELFCMDEVNKKRLAVLFLGLVTTFSSTGFVVGALLILIYTLFRSDISVKKKAPIVVVLSAIIVLLFTYGNEYIVSTNVLSKLNQGMDNGSFRARWGSIIGNLSFFASDPLFGVGEYRLSNEFVGRLDFLAGFSEANNTNTFLSFFSGYGILFGIVCVVGWYKTVRKNNKSLLSFLIFITFFLLLSGENMWHSILFWLIVFYGIGSNVYDNTEVTYNER